MSGHFTTSPAPSPETPMINYFGVVRQRCRWTIVPVLGAEVLDGLFTGGTYYTTEGKVCDIPPNTRAYGTAYMAARAAKLRNYA